MRREPRRWLVALFMLHMAGIAPGGETILRCDVGGCGPVQAGWISLASCGVHTNVGGTGDLTLVAVAVPEPSTFALAALGLLGLLGFRRRRRR